MHMKSATFPSVEIDPNQKGNMADFITQAVADIDSRLSELRTEASQLEQARTALTGITSPKGNGASAAKPAPPKASTKRGPGRPKGRRSSTRASQALAHVQSNPGATIPDIAGALKIEPNYLYRVMPKLVEDGEVARDGDGGYVPASA